MDAYCPIIAEPVVLAPCLCKLSFIQQSSHSGRKVLCSVEGCQYLKATAANIRQHFFNRHYTYRLHIKEDNSIPSYCRGCGILVSLYSLQCAHLSCKYCNTNIQCNQQRERNETIARDQTRKFNINGIVLKRSNILYI